MGGGQNGASVSSVRGLQDAGKAVAEAAGSVASDRVRVEVDARSSRAAVELKAFGVAMRASSASLRDQGHEGQADLVDEVAARADRLAARLASADTDDLVEDAKHLASQAAAFARREPALVIAGAFTLGLLVPKVLEIVAKEASEREE
ncbi:MAG TPA: hypothetical protein VG993_04260 [Actinomycetota bacterium]|jgi:hypothetical protein|nr:hypothetical protein [Actinomycetota bacterium]